MPLHLAGISFFRKKNLGTI